MEPPTLEGLHVRIEPLAIEHAPGLFEAGRSEDVWRFMPRGPLRDEADARAFVEQALARPESTPFAIIDLAGGRLAGSTRFLAISEEHRRLEIGYTWLAPRHWRTAINTETKLLMLRHAFEQWAANRVEFKTDAENLRSQRALERIGAVREGVLRRHMIVRDGRARDSVYYSILPDEWPEVCASLTRALERHAGSEPLEL